MNFLEQIIVTLSSYVVIGIFCFKCLTLESEEKEAGKKEAAKIKRQQQKQMNGGYR